MFNKLISSKMSKTMSRDIDNMVTIYMNNRGNNRDFTRDESPLNSKGNQIVKFISFLSCTKVSD